MAGYYGMHDMTATIYGTTAAPNKIKSMTIHSDFTRKVKRDLIVAKDEASSRGLIQSFNWCAELSQCVQDVKLTEEVSLVHTHSLLGEEAHQYDRSKGLFDSKDYFRAAYFSEQLKHPLCRFLHLYSRYCAYEQKINNDSMDSITLLPKNTPGPHLYEIAHCLGPGYQKVTRKENYPSKSKGLVGIGSYQYLTNITKKTPASNITMSAGSGGGVHNKTSHNKSRKLIGHLEDHLHNDKINIDNDLEDFDLTHLEDDIDGIEIDDSEFEDVGSSNVRASGHSKKHATGEPTVEEEACASDSYMMWLYGVVLKQMGHRRQALEVLCWAIHQAPHNWAAWAELAELIVKRSTLEQLDLPDVWQRRVFLCQVFVELNLDDDCLAACEELTREGLADSVFVRTQRALAFRNLRDYDLAILEFDLIELIDPFRVESADIYSNLLYVKERRVELANLAARMVQVAKYSVETCCVVGNYLSMRGEHEKAVVYFQRALKLNPKFVSAYTLMGYEYMEMKNTIQAIQCYRNALRINRRDYRAWFGLGQTYEVLKLLNYSLFYFKQAQRLHPYDSRMITALGEAFEKKEMFLEAKKCFVKSHSVGDVEGTALLKLAKLYERLTEPDRAADAYDRYLLETDGEESDELEERGRAHVYLAKYMLSHNEYNQAEEHAKKCVGCSETQEIGKSLLKEIAHKRNLADTKPTVGTEPRISAMGNRVRTNDDEQPRLPPPTLRTTFPPSDHSTNTRE